MACKSCEEKALARLRDEAIRTHTFPKLNPMLYITCFCGLARLLPENFTHAEGAILDLPACPRCGSPIHGVVQDGKIAIEA